MIEPAPTSRIDPTLARGTLVEFVSATATKPALVKAAFPNTNYELHLVPGRPISTQPGKRLIGRVEARARRVDIVEAGGRYIEPVIGRPRRVQGVVISADQGAGTITVDAGVPIKAGLTDARQSPADFTPGTLVAFDIVDGATFTPAA